MSYSLLASSALCLSLALTACGTPQTRTSETPSTTTESSNSGETTSKPEEAPSTVDAYLDQLETKGFEGSVIIQEGDETTSRGFGFADRENQVPNGTDTIFDVGSITKQFTAAAILRLEMDGQLTVDDPIATYVDDLPAGYEDVTLHHLLTHSSGIRDGNGGDYDEVDLAAFVAALAPLESTPGDTYDYSNSGYSLLAAAIERVTGDSYEVYLNEALFTSAKMPSTGYLLPKWDQANVAIGYDDQEEGAEPARPNEFPWADDGPYWYLRGNGGIMSSAEDMMRWHTALTGDSILDAEAKEKLYTPHIPETEGASISYGYGWSIESTESAGTVIAHNGGNGIFFADFVRFVDADLTIYLASNSNRADTGNEAYDLAGIILDTDEFDDPTAPCIPSPEELAAFPEIVDFPDDPAGQTMEELMSLFAEGDEAAWREFAETSVNTDFAPPEFIVEQAGILQAEFGSFEVTQILQASPQTFHVWITAADKTEYLISGDVTNEEPPQLACIDVSNP